MKKQVFKLFVVAALFSARSLFGAGYATDVAIVGEAQAQALDEAREMLARTEKPAAHDALQKAIKEMERAESMLTDAKNKPETLAAAVAAEQAAYQDILKTVPHDFRISRGGRGAGSGQAGQPGRRQLDQLELTSEDDRYETERQATAGPTPQEREQSQVADRLKQLAQRQQDLNDRLKELQTALAQARTEQEREEIQRQLKRLSDEEKQMLADVDDLRQTLDQSPNAESMSKARQQLDQARSDTQRASQQLQNNSVSDALAAGTRAQEGMRNLRESLRNQAASQFTQQMRQLRSQARDLAKQEEAIGSTLQSLENPERKSLDDSAQRQQLVQKMAEQQSGLTNLLDKMQNVSEQAETSEPLLSQQLYDTLRRASQMHNDNLLQTGAELLDHGLVTQAAGAESAVHKNLNELRDKVERAAESVLGNETDALRYAQKELDDLSAQVGKEGGAVGTNSAAGGTNSTSGSQQTSSQKTGQRGTKPGAGDEKGTAGTEPGNGENGTKPGSANGQNGTQPGSGTGQAGTERGLANGQGGTQRASASGQGGQESASAGGQAGGGDGDRLREAAQQFGGATRSGGAGGLGNNGPITGNDFVNWADRMRDVEQVVDSPELRNQLASVREHVAAFRADYRQHKVKPDPKLLRAEVLNPLAEVRTRLDEDLARLANAKSLVPLDHDPVPENYSEMVRKYYEKLGGGQ
ncbi:MAG TPA: hypothetical protein VH619_10835 [Verrucomicrobiae bacterium]|jgi:hypothetical protein|nr:hypothetical protein [Verrucomicrobiae bacterium]